MFVGKRCVFLIFIHMKSGLNQKRLFEQRKKITEKMKTTVFLITFFSMIIIYLLSNSYFLRKEIFELNNKINLYEKERKEKLSQISSTSSSHSSHSPATHTLPSSQSSNKPSISFNTNGWITNLIGNISFPTSTEIKELLTIPKLQENFDKEYFKNKSPTRDLLLSPLQITSDTKYGNLSLSMYNQRYRVDDIAHGYQYIFEGASLFTYTNFFGVKHSMIS